MKQITKITTSRGNHWVGDGFPVRNLFSYDQQPDEISPFLLFDYAGPHVFDPSTSTRGVGAHPHRGFETITIVYDGEVSHRDSTGAGGTIGPGDVQWMTAGAGIVHEEFHSPSFSKTGGPFRMVQLWLNLPAKDKSEQPGYQSLSADNIPNVDLGGGSFMRVIAGNYNGSSGPAHTFSPVNVFDMQLKRDRQITLDLPQGHTSMLAVLSGHITVNGGDGAGEAEIIHLSRDGNQVQVTADSDAMVLVLTGEPIAEPVYGRGPFVMNTAEEIRSAYEDYANGKFGTMV